jgi:hypothetical protein
LQFPKKEITGEWKERNMQEVGVDKVVRDLFYFMRREVLHQDGLFFDHTGPLKQIEELSMYTNANTI